MAAHNIDLNLEPPDCVINEPVDWNSIAEWDGPAHELDYVMVWEDGDDAGGEAPDNPAAQGKLKLLCFALYFCLL